MNTNIPTIDDILPNDKQPTQNSQESIVKDTANKGKGILPSNLAMIDRIQWVANKITQGEYGYGLILCITKEFSIGARQALNYQKKAVEYLLQNEKRFNDEEHAAVIIEQLKEVYKQSLSARKFKESVSALGLISKIKGIDHPEYDKETPSISISFNPTKKVEVVDVDESPTLILENNSDTPSPTLITESGEAIKTNLSINRTTTTTTMTNVTTTPPPNLEE